MTRSVSKEGSENGVDGSALPSSANWARNPQRSRRGSHATSGAASSPAISTSLPVTAEAVPEEAVEDTQEPVAGPSASNQPKEPEATPEPAKDIPESSLKALLKALQGCALPRLADSEADDLGPPMFDVRGGEKRRIMREEDDTRLSGEQEEPAEAREPSEGEPETGGSLALGGEPEDRDTTSDSRGFDRRPSTQPPIQRSTTDEFRQSGFAIHDASAAFLRSQSGFGDVPPGISNQGNTFQGQGHNRQSSRFSFANDNASSATNVKLAANPRIMAQQSSMMPNSFQSQGNNQFYGTSMPGPPPGLKSTGTPPSMFGQFGGAGFGGAPKDNSNELLQSLIGRSRAGNSQTHDAGKREYMISSFSNQYPPSSTSTPAPASGLLASLYGNQPGAFQDMGSKQKKKGKKHRHANTSSSGGSGLVDLADPSILQARMQHQSQGNAGVGQGLFGGQSQDDELPSLDEATNSVDALVSDDPIGIASDLDDRRSVPPGPLEIWPYRTCITQGAAARIFAGHVDSRIITQKASDPCIGSEEDHQVFCLREWIVTRDYGPVANQADQGRRPAGRGLPGFGCAEKQGSTFYTNAEGDIKGQETGREDRG
ncbi:hypothetical protein NM208_g16005 [Fusarium decemcellulare]|uniref:Uncharacterized protein n=1 Tax=Fusarium decemcellulare TaxID=57161 RepID=A0ACC1REV1_9HYPO|nr:hypothetical protein NM208_g16005 [Fusarium decemcellulare]